ncbi:MAG: PhnD/SsuA/transferrin family substrate-binding protein [Candidatus Marinimicrobia bacterium]|nr:PhnD/SsuA/transferrin family substrate-binding protein [Candidatus Neomarinimicrobiota bacterium]
MNTRNQFKLLFIATIVFILIWWFFNSAMDISIHSEDIHHPSDINGEPVRYFGIVPRYTPREIYIGYQPIVDFLTEYTPYRFELKLGKSYNGIAEQLAQGNVAIASLGSFVYVTNKDAYGLEVILKSLNPGGKDYFNTTFITHDTTGIKSLSDLKGKTLLLPSKESLTGQWMPVYLEKKARVSPAELKEINFVSHHTTVAEKVLKGEFDAGVVKSVIAEKYEDRGLRVFHKSPQIPPTPIVVSEHTDQETREAVITALLSIDIEDPETASMLKSWDEEFSHGFKPARDSDYDIIRTIVSSLAN